MRNNEFGRSMIEMLGVLSIVGVLSVAGISGYSRVMGKQKSTKVVDQFSQIHNNLHELYRQENGFDENWNITDAVKMDIFPEEMTKTCDLSKTDDCMVIHAGGGTVSLTFEEDDVSVTFNDLQQDAAIALSTAGFKSNWVKVGGSER